MHTLSIIEKSCVLYKVRFVLNKSTILATNQIFLNCRKLPKQKQNCNRHVRLLIKGCNSTSCQTFFSWFSFFFFFCTRVCVCACVCVRVRVRMCMLKPIKYNLKKLNKKWKTCQKERRRISIMQVYHTSQATYKHLPQMPALLIILYYIYFVILHLFKTTW